MLSEEGQWEENGMRGCCANHSSSVTKTVPQGLCQRLWGQSMLRLGGGGTIKRWSLLWRSQVIGVWIWKGYWDSSLLLPLRPGHQKVNDFLYVFFHYKAPATDLKVAETAGFGLESLKIGSNISLCFFETVYFRNFVTTDTPGDPKTWKIDCLLHGSI